MHFTFSYLTIHYFKLQKQLKETDLVLKTLQSNLVTIPPCHYSISDRPQQNIVAFWNDSGHFCTTKPAQKKMN